MRDNVSASLKEPPEPTTSEELEHERGVYQHFLEVMAWLCVPAFIVLCVLGMVLPYNLQAEGMPRLLRPVWNPYGITIIPGLLFTLAIRLSKFGREYSKHVPLIRAIKAYDRGREQFARWQDRRAPQALINSYECVNNAATLLKGVQEFQDFRTTVLKDYALHCEKDRK